MSTSNIKKYAPNARADFMAVVANRRDQFDINVDMQITLDLDDGVKVNYGKFGDLLVDVKGVTGKK